MMMMMMMNSHPSREFIQQIFMHDDEDVGVT